MATLVDHKARTVTRGTPEDLVELMVTGAMLTPHARRLPKAGRERYARAHVVAAIRRDGVTDTRQQLVMSDVERAAWLAAHPEPAD